MGALERRPPTWSSPSWPRNGCTTKSLLDDKRDLGGTARKWAYSDGNDRFWELLSRKISAESRSTVDSWFDRVGECPRMEARKLCANLMTHAVTCNSVLYELNLDSSHSALEVTRRLHAMGLVSSPCNAASSVAWGCLGIWIGSASSHGGAVHHNLWSLSSLGGIPLDAQSAGLSCVGTPGWRGDQAGDSGNSVAYVGLIPFRCSIQPG